MGTVGMGGKVGMRPGMDAIAKGEPVPGGTDEGGIAPGGNGIVEIIRFGATHRVWVYPAWVTAVEEVHASTSPSRVSMVV